MIRVTPYYAWKPEEAQRVFERDYLRMVAAVTPFFPEDMLFDDPEGLAACVKAPKTRSHTGNGKNTDTAIGKLLKLYEVEDGEKPEGQLVAEAVLAERIVERYSTGLHNYLYQSAGNGFVNRYNLRELLVLKLREGKVPEYLNFKLDRKDREQKKHAKALYEYVFPYDRFSKLKNGNGHIGIHDFVERLGVKVCPYCNRLFVTTANSKNRRVQPQLDHFRNKNDYPFLALSVNNLIPSCGVCNLLKLANDEDMIYPYEESFADEEHIFATNIPLNHTVPALEGIAISKEDFKIELKFNGEMKDEKRGERIKKSIGILALEELYQSHREYVSNLYRQRYILTNQMAQDIYKQFPNLYSSENDVEFLFALMNTDREHWGERPLAKLTHDIRAEIDELYGEG